MRTFFVTSVRGSDFAPQMAAKAGLKTFLAKMLVHLVSHLLFNGWGVGLSVCMFMLC